MHASCTESKKNVNICLKSSVVSANSVCVYLAQECWAVCLQGSLWKESLGLLLQPKLRLFCFPPTRPSRASTTDHSHVQTPAPVKQHVTQ